MTDLELQLADGTHIAVPASLDAITTYVLLEQEAWFEKEAAFVAECLRPGMTAIDIGANAGIYSLPIARRVGPNGRVYAYEPGSDARLLLEKGRVLNGVGQLTILPSALSDGAREGRLAQAASSELRKLSADADGESIAITSLDIEDGVREWSPDFVKIDAEGEERRILAGGKTFFARHSPLVMFEIRTEKTDLGLADEFRARGYGIFRLVPGLAALAPVGRDDALDPMELNLFAAKPDRASALARDGRLIESTKPWQPDDAEIAAALASLQRQVFAVSFRHLWRSRDLPYARVLAAYAAACNANAPLPLRHGALRYACETLSELCRVECSASRLSTLARIAAELGENHICNAALSVLLGLAQQNEPFAPEPFWPAAARFDTISPGPNPQGWCLLSVTESAERHANFSTYFGGGTAQLDWLASQPLASAEMVRRRALRFLRAGGKFAVPPRLLRSTADHHNAQIWRSGLIPNTIMPSA